MIEYSQGIKDSLWKKLQQIFSKYSDGKNVIQNAQFQRVVTEVLNETSPPEIDYVMKNIFRLDQDASGAVDFNQFGSFLLLRHCGEMALQKMHKEGKMSHGHLRKMNVEEFNTLMNNAYAFLGVKVDAEAATAIFKSTDKDNDGFITYQEYFQYMVKHIIQPKHKPEPLPVPATTTDEALSFLREYLWAKVREIYDRFDKDKNQQLSVQELETVIREIFKDCSDEDINYIIVNAFHMNPSANGYLVFNDFAPFFIIHAAELGLSKFTRMHPSQRSISRQEFVRLFRNCFFMLDPERVTQNVLHAWFDFIDTNKDGRISFAEFLNWVKNFLAVLHYYGAIPDIDNRRLGLGNRAIYSEYQMKCLTKTARVIPFHFSDLSLARRVRERTLELIEKNDEDKNKNLEDREIVNILQKLMKSDVFDIFYVQANAFRYDSNMDGFITYDEMTDFFVEMHFGQIALQRLHKVNKFERGDERVMNLKEFIMTLEDCLKYIDVKPLGKELEVLFSDIDQDNDGWISYKTYFEFLRTYFGSMSVVRQEISSINRTNSLLKRTESQTDNPIKIFVRQVTDAIAAKMMEYGALQSYDENEITKFLKTIFGLTPEELDFILKNFLKYNLHNNSLFIGSDAAKILLEILFAEIALRRRHLAKNFKRWQERMISKDEFVDLVLEACFWMPVKPTRKLLEDIFVILDEDKDGFISYKCYVDFIRQYLSGRAGGAWNFQWDVKTPADEKTVPVAADIWSELRALYNRYVKGKYLQESELEAMVREVLQETTKRELQYIFWNMFRYDPNSDRNIEFEQFAPFILPHTAEIALQRFHYQQPLGKSKINKEEFFVLFTNAFHFLKNLHKNDQALSEIFCLLDTNKDGFITYKEYMTWIVVSIAKTVR